MQYLTICQSQSQSFRVFSKEVSLIFWVSDDDEEFYFVYNSFTMY